jgi:hypothetical protein
MLSKSAEVIQLFCQMSMSALVCGSPNRLSSVTCGSRSLFPVWSVIPHIQSSNTSQPPRLVPRRMTVLPLGSTTLVPFT